jgi:hypothetical protein
MRDFRLNLSIEIRSDVSLNLNKLFTRLAFDHSFNPLRPERIPKPLTSHLSLPLLTIVNLKVIEQVLYRPELLNLMHKEEILYIVHIQLYIP